MTSRYDGRDTARNSDSIYDKIFLRRWVSFINQYKTGTLRYPTQQEISSLTLVPHAWKIGDKLYKLADYYYNDATMWWVIAWFNQYPTEAHIKIGYVIQIPTPVERILQILEV